MTAAEAAAVSGARDPVALALFAAYLAAVVGIGVRAARRSAGTQEDYFLANRSFSPLVTALSAVSSGRSAWLMMGAAVAAWTHGLSAVWYFPGYVAVEAVLFVTLGRRLRDRSAALGAITVPEFVARAARGPDGRAGTSRLPLRPLAAALVVAFLVTYVSAQLVAGGKALAHVFQVDGRTWGLVVTAGIVLVYTFLGGYRAVALTDVLQALFMLCGLVVLPLLALWDVGGPGGLRAALADLDPALLSWSRGLWPLVGGLAIGLGSMGNPHILVRYMSIRDPRELRLAAVIGTVWNVVMAGGALLLGLAGRALHPTAAAFPGEDADFLFPVLAEALSRDYLFAGFAGILLATLFAAIMSTCDSQLLVVASSLARDFRGARPAADGRGLAASRATVAVALAVAVAMSYGAERVVDTFVLASWGALGAAFGPVLLLLLYGRGLRASGAAAGMLAGAAVTVLWLRLPLGDGATPKSATGVYELVPAFAAGLAAAFLVDRAGPRSAD